MAVPREPYLISCFWPKFHTSFCNLALHINCKCCTDSGSVLYSIDQPGISIYQNSYLPRRLMGTIFSYTRLQTSGNIKKINNRYAALAWCKQCFFLCLCLPANTFFTCIQFISVFVFQNFPNPAPLQKIMVCP